MDEAALARFESALQATAADLPAAFFPDFRRLARGLQSEMHAWRLFLLKFEHRSGQEQVSAALRKLFGEMTVVHAMPYENWIDLELALRDAAKLGKPIEIPDLDQWLEDYPDPERADRRLGAWNIQRESCALNVPVPLLCWLRPARMSAFAQRALDLWSWRHGLYDFSARRWETGDDLQKGAPLMPDFWRIDSRDEPVKRARIAEIQHYLSNEGNAAGERLRVSLLTELADLHKGLSEWDEALRIYSEQALPAYRQLGNQAGEGRTLGSIGPLYLAWGDYHRALDYLQQSMAIFKQINDKASEGSALTNISQIFHRQGDSDTALDYLKQSLTIYQQIGDKAVEGIILNNLGQIHLSKGDNDTALDYLKQALSICQQTENKTGEGAVLNNISQIYLHQGDIATALDYQKQSLSIHKQIGDRAGLCGTLFNLGKIHFDQGERAEAIKAWLAAYRIAKDINLAQALDALAKLAPRLGMPPGLDGWEALTQQSAEANEKLLPDQIAELDSRVAEHLADPASAIPWEQVRTKLFSH